MATVIQPEKVWIEACEHFPKQTWRNRSSIMGPDGIHHLIVPLSGRKDKCLTKDIRIDHTQSWRKIHLRTLQACYRRSPWFEFYEDDLVAFFERKEDFLMDLNANLWSLLLGWIRKDVEFSFTINYEKIINGTDLRQHLNKQEVWKDYGIPTYKEGATEINASWRNVSVLDLIFHQGKNTAEVMRDIKVQSGASG